MSKKNPITVLHLCEHFGGKAASLHGVARAFQWWIPRFDRSRFRILLCSRKGHDQAADQMIQKGIFPHYLGLGKFDPRNLLRLIKLVRDQEVDIIHAHGYGACVWGRLTGLLLHKPVIVHERCNYRTVPRFQRPIERVLGPMTKHAFAVSESTKQFCVEKRYIPPSAIEVLYNGLPLDEVNHLLPESIDNFRRQLGAKPGRQIIGIVSRLEPHKGIIDAFRAFEVLLYKCPQTYLWVLGDGSHKETLMKLVDDRRLQEKIIFHGFRTDILEVAQCFDVQLFPSHEEGTPNTLFEALALGQAIVASTADGQGEILEDEVTALLFPAGDAAEMARQLFRILVDQQLRETISKNALKKSREFEGKKCIDRLQAKYEEIMVMHLSHDEKNSYPST